MFHWSLYEIDRTDIESLIPFVFYYPQWKDNRFHSNREALFADDVDWL